MLHDQEVDGRKMIVREERARNPAEGGNDRRGGRGNGRRPNRDRETFPPAGGEQGEIVSGTALYVGNLAWSTTTEQLQEFFATLNPEFAEVKFGRNARSRGYGIVSFATKEEATRALGVNGRELDGRAITVRFDQKPERF
jgi:RNA recognition motif-containing protein